jgi:hypothetical protein
LYCSLWIGSHKIFLWRNINNNGGSPGRISTRNLTDRLVEIFWSYQSTAEPLLGTAWTLILRYCHCIHLVFNKGRACGQISIFFSTLLSFTVWYLSVPCQCVYSPGNHLIVNALIKFPTQNNKPKSNLAIKIFYWGYFLILLSVYIVYIYNILCIVYTYTTL